MQGVGLYRADSGFQYPRGSLGIRLIRVSLLCWETSVIGSELRAELSHWLSCVDWYRRMQRTRCTAGDGKLGT